MRRPVILTTLLLLGGCCSLSTSSTEPPPPPPKAPAVVYGAASSITGRITGYTTTSNGSMDGVQLDNGGIIKFPAYAGSQLVLLVQKGQVVTGSGASVGNRTVAANRLTNLSTGQVVDVNAIPPPPPPSEASAPLPGAVQPPG